LRDRHEEITAAGGDVVAIGMGWPEAAAAFKQEFRIPFPLLVDRTKESYRALGMRRGNLWDVAGPHVWARGLQNMLKGHSPLARAKQDVLQLGGTVVVTPANELLLVHRSKTSEENLPVDDMIDALARAGRR
jgi:hypothetical protein